MSDHDPYELAPPAEPPVRPVRVPADGRAKRAGKAGPKLGAAEKRILLVLLAAVIASVPAIASASVGGGTTAGPGPVPSPRVTVTATQTVSAPPPPPSTAHNGGTHNGGAHNGGTPNGNTNSGGTPSGGTNSPPAANPSNG